MKNIAVGKSTFSESSSNRGDLRSSRVRCSSTPRGFGAEGFRTVAWAARWTRCQIRSLKFYRKTYQVIRAHSTQVHSYPG